MDSCFYFCGFRFGIFVDRGGFRWIWMFFLFFFDFCWIFVDLGGF